MNTEPTGTEVPAADVDVPVTPATVETSEATTEQQSEAETPENGDEAAAQPKKKHWAHDRIDELTRARREAERQAEYWKSKATNTVDPNTLDYEEGIAERVSQRNRQEQAETATATATQLAAEAFSYRETIVREQYADYDVVAKNPNLAITEAMARVIRESDAGPQIAYHLGKNPTEAARIAVLSPEAQAFELGAIKAAILSPKTAPKVPASPIKPVTAVAAGGEKDPDSMSIEEWMTWRNKQARR